MMVGMANRIPQGIQEVLRRSNVRVPQPQVDDISPLLLHLGQAQVHFRAQISPETIHPFGQLHF
jgi:acyl-coenzyme A thioesterase PaaI-like protein